MILTMRSVLGDEPAGGISMVWGFAGAMADRGHEVHLLHTDVLGPAVSSVDEVTWFELHPDIQHHFVRAEGLPTIEGSDFHFVQLPRPKEDYGLPMIWLQGWGVFPHAYERAFLRAPFPKLCVSRYLRDVAVAEGVRPHQAVYVPQAIRHDQFRITRPIEDRPRKVSMLYYPGEGNGDGKGADLGLEVITDARAEVPDLEAVLFGVLPAPPDLPDWVSYHHLPDERHLVDDVYNASSIFLNPSPSEGFGLVGVEAMACGCALVTADSGGPRDYADHGDTALVAGVRDRAGMTEQILRLLRDDELRIGIADRGAARARTYTWERSALELETFLLEYGADPERYRQLEDIAFVTES
jgi:glycosyltransferase involved in cell wall biosynthesis